MSTIPPIGALADVATGDLIEGDWGNAVGASSAGRVVHRFATPADRDAAIPAPVAGMLCYVQSTDALYFRNAAGAWVALSAKAHARVSRSAIWTLPTTATVIPFDTVERDPLAMFSVSTHQFTVPLAGIWLVTTSCLATPPAGGGMAQIITFLNGGTKGGANGQSSSAINIQPNLSNIIKANPGDKIEVRASAYPVAMSSSYADPTTTWANLSYLGTG